MSVCLVDSGGVLFANVTEDSPFFETLGAWFEVDAAFLRRWYEVRDADFEVGTMTATAVLVGALTAAGVPRARIDPAQIRALYRGSLVPNRDVLDVLAARPRGGDHARVALANNEARDWDELKHELYGHFDLFDVIVSSWAVGHVKPSDAYFEAALAKCGAEPGDAILVDDDAGCLAAARAFGLRATRFEGPASLVDALEEAGVR